MRTTGWKYAVRVIGMLLTAVSWATGSEMVLPVEDGSSHIYYSPILGNQLSVDTVGAALHLSNMVYPSHGNFRSMSPLDVVVFDLSGLDPAPRRLEVTFVSDPTYYRSYVPPGVTVPDHDVPKPLGLKISARAIRGPLDFEDLYFVTRDEMVGADNQIVSWHRPVFQDIETVTFFPEEYSQGDIISSTDRFGDFVNDAIEWGPDFLVVSLTSAGPGTGGMSFASIEHPIYDSARMITHVPEPLACSIMVMGFCCRALWRNGNPRARSRGL